MTSRSRQSRSAPLVLGRDAILAAGDLESEVVPVPEWGGGVVVRTMTGLDRDRWEARLRAHRTEGGTVTLDHARAELVVATVVGADGQPLFGYDDVEALSAKSAKALDRVVAVAQRINGLGRDDLDDAVKN